MQDNVGDVKGELVKWILLRFGGSSTAMSRYCGCQKWGRAYDNLPLEKPLKKHDFWKIWFGKQKISEL